MNPTGWGSLTIFAALAIALDIAWVRSSLKQGKRGLITAMAFVGGVLLCFLVLFSFIGWESCYK